MLIKLHLHFYALFKWNIFTMLCVMKDCTVISIPYRAVNDPSWSYTVLLTSAFSLLKAPTSHFRINKDAKEMVPSPGTVKLREGSLTALWYYPDWTEESAEQTWCHQSGQEGECGVCAVVMSPELWSICFITGISGLFYLVANIRICQSIDRLPGFCHFNFSRLFLPGLWLWITLKTSLKSCESCLTSLP